MHELYNKMCNNFLVYKYKFFYRYTIMLGNFLASILLCVMLKAQPFKFNFHHYVIWLHLRKVVEYFNSDMVNYYSLIVLTLS